MVDVVCWVVDCFVGSDLVVGRQIEMMRGKRDVVRAFYVVVSPRERRCRWVMKEAANIREVEPRSTRCVVGYQSWGFAADK